jgi:anti-anti-sigma regulatory factor
VATQLPPADDPADDTPGFRIHVDMVSGQLTMAGRPDRYAVRLVHDAISTVLATGRRENWTVDVTELVVTDTSGLRAISAAYRRLVSHGRRMTLLGATPQLQEGLARLRLSHHVLQGGDGHEDAPTPTVVAPSEG